VFVEDPRAMCMIVYLSILKTLVIGDSIYEIFSFLVFFRSDKGFRGTGVLV